MSLSYSLGGLLQKKKKKFSINIGPSYRLALSNVKFYCYLSMFSLLSFHVVSLLFIDSNTIAYLFVIQ